MIRLHPATTDVMANALATAIDASGRPGTISFYAGPMPANSEGRSPEHVYARLEFAKPAFAGASNGRLVARPIKQGVAAITGRVAWARIADGAGRTVFDCDVGAPDAKDSGGALIQMNSVHFSQGGPVTLESFVLTMGAQS